MILYNNKDFITNSCFPDFDWIGDADYVIPDGSELAEKIMGLYPYFDFVFDGEGKLTDVTPTKRPPESEPEPTLEEIVAEQAKIIAKQQEQIAMLTECMLEVSEYVYN